MPCVAVRFIDDVGSTYDNGGGSSSGAYSGNDVDAACLTEVTVPTSGNTTTWCEPICMPTEYGAFCGADASVPTGCHAVIVLGYAEGTYCCPCGDTVDQGGLDAGAGKDAPTTL